LLGHNLIKSDPEVGGHGSVPETRHRVLQLSAVAGEFPGSELRRGVLRLFDVRRLGRHQEVLHVVWLVVMDAAHPA
jgi:hypothetical protein